MEQDKIDEFVSQNEIILDETDSSKSFKTNLLLIKNNFKKISTYYKLMHEFILYVYNLIDIDSITQNVLDNIQTTKKFVSINYDLIDGQTVADGDYLINRELNIITITKAVRPEQWNTDLITVCTKDVNGHIVYPAVTTKNNSIKINFIDGLKSNYVVILY